MVPDNKNLFIVTKTKKPMLSGICSSRKQIKMLSSDFEANKKEIKIYREIDELIYKIYGITEKEKKIIDEGLK